MTAVGLMTCASASTLPSALSSCVPLRSSSLACVMLFLIGAKRLGSYCVEDLSGEQSWGMFLEDVVIGRQAHDHVETIVLGLRVELGGLDNPCLLLPELVFPSLGIVR